MNTIKDAFEKGFVGTITYNEYEDSYQLSTPLCDYGLQNAGHWQDYEGEKVKVTIKVEILKTVSDGENKQ